MNFRWRRSHRPRFRSLMLLLLVVAVCPLIGYTAFVLGRLLTEQRRGSERGLVEAARTQGMLVERELANSIRTLRVLAESDSLARGDLQAFSGLALRAKKTQPTWFTVILLRPDGGMVLNTALPLGATATRRAVDPDSLRAVIESGQPIVGNLRRGDNRIGFAVRVPVHREGRLAYVLTAVLTPEGIGELIDRQLPLAGQWTRTIVDAGGTVVARTRAPARFVGQPATPSFMVETRRTTEGIVRETTMEGEPVYMAFSRSPSFDWTSVIAVPVDTIEASFRRSLTGLGLVSILALLLTGGGSYFVARRVSRDLEDMASAAEALVRGENRSIPAAIVAEIDRLGQSLTSSARLLAQRQHERDEHLRRAEGALASAEEASRIKDQFLAMLGHELRNPLSPIVTALHVLRLRGQHDVREFAIIERQVQHLTRLVDDLLDVSRITRGAVDLKKETLELTTVVTRAVEMASPLLEERQHRLTLDVPASDCLVVADATRLAQVFANLLTNAAKYTPAGGNIHMRARREDDQIVVDVTDDGQGIPADLLPKVFDLFVQGQRTSDRRDGGLGLGLTVVRSLVLLHEGQIEVRSDGIGHGSTFTIRLPAAVGTRCGTDDDEGATLGSLALSILVVDDNPDAAETLATLLRAQGHDVMSAPDGPAALAIVEGFRADVAVLDLGLPAMDGYELAARLRELLGDATPAFVAVTGYGQTHDRERSLAEGFQAHLVKPVPLDDLVAVLARVAGDRAALS